MATSEWEERRESLLAEMDAQTEWFVHRVRDEVARARRKHAPMNSAHEGWAVIVEEVEEFWDEVKLQTEARSPENMLKELIHVAAMAARCATDIGLTAGKAGYEK